MHSGVVFLSAGLRVDACGRVNQEQ